MNKQIRLKLIDIATKKIGFGDPAHDIEHTLRVLVNAESISKKEGGDLDIIIPAALFHDAVCYEKNTPENAFSVKESAEFAEQVLTKIVGYPKEKIPKVKYAITCASFTHGAPTKSLEDEIVQAADMLEAVGVIAVMRTFAYSGRTQRPFYDPADPFAENREINAAQYGIDLFYERLLRIEELIKTKTAKKIAIRRTIILKKFLAELKRELKGQ